MAKCFFKKPGNCHETITEDGLSLGRDCWDRTASNRHASLCTEHSRLKPFRTISAVLLKCSLPSSYKVISYSTVGVPIASCATFLPLGPCRTRERVPGVVSSRTDPSGARPRKRSLTLRIDAQFGAFPSEALARCRTTAS